MVWVPALALRGPVSLLIDTGASRTSLSPRDLEAPPLSPLPPDDAASVVVAGGLSVFGRPMPAMLTFTHDDGTTWATLVELLVTDGPPGHARLGTDVLRHLLLVIDPGDSQVVLEPVG